MNVTLVQPTLQWQSPTDNQLHLWQLVETSEPADVVVLPEMWSTGFSMASAQLAEPMDGPSVRWMAELAAARQTRVAGSLIIKADQRYYNRFIWMEASGEYQYYDKRHLFRMSGEHEHYAPGRARELFTAENFRVFPQVCYDLRFPVFSRNDLGYDLIVYVANWPAVRREHWRALLRARAIENLCYVVGVNRIGTDGNDVDYCGDSMVIDYQGDIIADLGDFEIAQTVHLDLPALQKYRTAFPAWKDADGFDLNPDHTGAPS